MGPPRKARHTWWSTLWCQLEDMFELIIMPQGIEEVTIQLIDTPTKQSFPSPSIRVPISSLKLLSRFFRDRFRVRGHTGSNCEADSESDSETPTERLGISSPSLPYSI